MNHRYFRNSDAKDVSELVHAALNRECTEVLPAINLDFMIEAHSVESLSNSYVGERRRVLFDNDKLVGYGSMYNNQIGSIYTVKNNLGYGSKILSLLLDDALISCKHSGKDPSEIDIKLSSLLNAEKFYAKNGFKRDSLNNPDQLVVDMVMNLGNYKK